MTIIFPFENFTLLTIVCIQSLVTGDYFFWIEAVENIAHELLSYRLAIIVSPFKILQYQDTKALYGILENLSFRVSQKSFTQKKMLAKLCSLHCGHLYNAKTGLIPCTEVACGFYFKASTMHVALMVHMHQLMQTNTS